jgi:hypothetical protein
MDHHTAIDSGSDKPGWIMQRGALYFRIQAFICEVSVNMLLLAIIA